MRESVPEGTAFDPGEAPCLTHTASHQKGGTRARCLLMAAAIMLFASPALAAPPDPPDPTSCAGYANDAVQMAAYAQVEGAIWGVGTPNQIYWFGGKGMKDYPLLPSCGFSGPRWSTDYNDHYNWCMAQASMWTVGAEAQARRDDFQYCAVCLQYVSAAQAVEADAKASLCAVRGANWPTNPQGLLQFCLAQGHSDVSATVNWLQNQLDRGQGQINTCVAARGKRPGILKPNGSVVSRPAGTATKPARGPADFLHN